MFLPEESPTAYPLQKATTDALNVSESEKHLSMKVKTGKSTKTAKANISLNILKNKIQPNTYFLKS